MSTKEIAYSLLDRLTESQLNAIVGILKELSGVHIYNEVEPDEIDLKMIEEAESDSSDPEPIEEYAKRLGIDYDSL